MRENDLKVIEKEVREHIRRNSKRGDIKIL
jgi:hypothetical protein